MTVSEFNLRVFFAIELPESVKSAVAEILGPLKKKFDHPKNRWASPENYHVTLQFLPAVNPLDILRLIDKTRAAIAGFKPFKLSLGPLELFPYSALTPKLITLGTQPQDELSQLAASVGEGIVAAGYVPDERLFRGHLTLCRLNASARKKITALPEMSLSLPAFDVRQVVLFRSEKIEKNYEYTVLERFHSKNV